VFFVPCGSDLLSPKINGFPLSTIRSGTFLCQACFLKYCVKKKTNRQTNKHINATENPTYLTTVDVGNSFVLSTLHSHVGTGPSLANGHSCLTHRNIETESAGPTVEGMIHQQTIFVSTHLQMSPRLFLDPMDHTSTDYCLDRFFWATRFLFHFFLLYLFLGQEHAKLSSRCLET